MSGSCNLPYLTCALEHGEEQPPSQHHRSSGFMQCEVIPPCEEPSDYGGVWLGIEPSDYGGELDRSVCCGSSMLEIGQSLCRVRVPCCTAPRS